jgi:hypothetical protein
MWVPVNDRDGASGGERARRQVEEFGDCVSR